MMYAEWNRDAFMFVPRLISNLPKRKHRFIWGYALVGLFPSFITKYKIDSYTYFLTSHIKVTEDTS
ncbi:hypothetical protein ACQP3C_31330, partial [Escherichia coli]